MRGSAPPDADGSAGLLADLRRRALWLSPLCALPIVLWPVHEWRRLSPMGSPFPYLIELACLGLAVIALAVLFIALLMIAVRYSRRDGIRLGASGAIVLASVLLGGWLAGLAHQRALEDFVQRAEPVVASIHDWCARHGKPPATLDEVFPQGATTTGMAAFPEFRYSNSHPACDGNAWTLQVDIGEGFSFDYLVYHPGNSKDPRAVSSKRRIGRWKLVRD